MITPQSKIIVYVDMDDTLCDFKGAFDRYRQTHPDIQFPQSIPNFFCELAPLPDAIETFVWLSAQPQFDVIILTAPSVKNPLCYTEKRLWIETHLGFEAVPQLVISRHKHLHKGHFLIDDQVTGRGQDRFEGTVIQFGSSAFPNWRSVRAHFELLIEQGHLPSLIEKTQSDIMCFRVFDVRDHFDAPVATFREALALLQSERAFFAAASDVVCYLRNGQSIPIPESFYIAKKYRFNSWWEAKKWALERAAKIKKNGKFFGLMGLAIADPKLPIDAQIEKALAYIETKIIDPAENDRICAELDEWLVSAIRALPKETKDAIPVQRTALDTTQVLMPSTELEYEEDLPEIAQDDHPESALVEDKVDGPGIPFAPSDRPARWVIASQSKHLPDIDGTGYFDLVNHRWVPSIKDASFIQDRNLANALLDTFDRSLKASLKQVLVSSEEQAKSAVKLSVVQEVIAGHEDSDTYLYETISQRRGGATSVVLHLYRPERVTLDRSDAGIEQLRVDIQSAAMDDLAIAWCKHRKLQGALGGPVGKEWGSPDCDYD